MEKGKISALQMGMLLYPAIVATAIISVPSLIAQHAGNDLWISPIFASLIGFLTVFIAIKLHHHYPTKTVIQYSEDILGKTVGKILGFFILFFYIELTGLIAKDYSEFIVSSFLPNTPQIIIIIPMIFLCAFAVYAGLEVVARSSQFLFPIFVFPLLLATFLLAKDFDIQNILPILENGVVPPIKGAIPATGWFAEAFLITFLLPFLSNKHKGMKCGMLSIVGVMVTIVLVCLITLFILGPAIVNKVYPLMNTMRYSSIGGMFENIEAAVMAIWILGAFVKLSIFYYVTVLGTAQWLNLSSYRPIVWPIGILIVQFAYWGLPNTMVMAHFKSFDFPVYSVFIQTAIPLLLLILVSLKTGKKQKNR